MKNKGAKTKFKKKGSIGAFGCDLTEYLESSGQDVPHVLKSCAEFIETHGVVDGIYRLSGVTSNIQKLRQEFGSDQPPDLSRDVYLQDIHCVGSLCKLYFRELPNPLLTYQLYSKFTDAVSCSVDGEKLFRILEVIQELPPSHYRTLEYLSKHLTHIASHSSTTNMHIRNLALVWAPNLLRSKEIEDAGCNGDAAFMEVRVQQVVIEFILHHVDQIFNKIPAAPIKQKDECRMMMKSMTLPLGSLPMKLVSLEEAQAMSLSATHPARKERRENSLPEIVPITGSMFHTVIDLPENKRKLSTKSKKWKSIFNLGRSGTESKTKLSRNGSVFVRGQKETSEKATIRPAKSMESLCSLPAEGEDEKMSRLKRSGASGGFFIPALKSRATGTGSTYDVSKHECEWDAEDVTGATGGLGSGQTNDKSPQPKPLPEQMKVFRVGDDLDSEQTSPKIRKMFYTVGDGAAKSSFPGSLFPLEASPRHQRKAMNISEPFAVSVPLRVSAVISTNSTPCRGSGKDRPLLSSLEELPLLDPERIDRISKSATLEKCSHTGIMERPRSPTIGNSDKQAGPKRTCSNEADAENEEATLTIKEILLEMLQEQEASEMAQKKLAAEQAPPPTDNLQTAISSTTSGLDPDSARTQQVENTRNQPEQTFHVDREEDTSLSFLDPLWSDIQQELKIIESEEEFPSSDFKEIPPPSVLPEDSSDTVQPTTDFSQSPLLPEEDNGGAVVNSLVLDDPCIQQNNSDQKQDSAQPHHKKLENIPQNTEFDFVQVEATDFLLPQENQLCKEHEGHVIGEKEILPNCDLDNGNSILVFFEPDPVKNKTGISNVTQFEAQEKDNLQVIVDTVESGRDKNIQMLRLERKSSGSLENDDELGGDNAHPFELEDFWEDHQWVTSPLHSPKLKNMPDKEALPIQPKRRGTTGGLYKRPEFTRSLSLDSKDTRTNKRTCKFVGMNRVDGLLHLRSEADMSMKQDSHNNCEQSRHVGEIINVSPPENQNTSSSAENTNDEEHRGDSLLQVPPLKSHETFHSTLMLPAIPVNSVDVQKRNGPPTISTLERPVDNNLNKEEASGKPKTRPSSLSLDISNPAGELFTFERAASCGSNDIGAQKIHATTKLSKNLNQGKGDSWTLPTKDNDLSYVPAAHAPCGRRNSAPVSVSAVRASFMIKMCQAKAVPVIPPKVQYTQIPQPLHTVNTDSEVLPEVKKELSCQPECNSTLSPTSTLCNAHTDKQKVLKPEKVMEEKENNDPISTESSNQPHGSQADSHAASQDAPLLRRKRTSDGEVSGDTSLSSKIDRPSGFSKSNFRSRPGRPQSLILFSPPFPIMDHPSPVDSRILLSPIKSPTHTTSQESALENQRTPDGVVLRNKLTIPKNGQRLETSTSCFYQPQRRSVILDSRSGRQIE